MFAVVEAARVPCRTCALAPRPRHLGGVPAAGWMAALECPAAARGKARSGDAGKGWGGRA